MVQCTILLTVECDATNADDIKARVEKALFIGLIAQNDTMGFEIERVQPPYTPMEHHRINPYKG